jgi:histidine triad (HIT) family protein
MSEKTLFSKIIDGEIPGDFVHRDESCVVIRDIDPQAPVHLLVIPVEPLPGIQSAEDDHRDLLGHLMLVARRVARDEGLADDGYRVVVNAGANGGQQVDHLHVHVLGGRQLRWPPG